MCEPHPTTAPLDLPGCWAAIAGTAAHRVLLEELHHRGLSPPTGAPADAPLLGPVEAERVAFLRAAGPWLPYREIATVLGWRGPAARAYTVVPLLAKAVLEGAGAARVPPTDGWRLPASGAGRPVVHYRWAGCLGALRRAAVLYEAVAPLLPADTLGLRLNQRAGF